MRHLHSHFLLLSYIGIKKFKPIEYRYCSKGPVLQVLPGTWSRKQPGKKLCCDSFQTAFEFWYHNQNEMSIEIVMQACDDLDNIPLEEDDADVAVELQRLKMQDLKVRYLKERQQLRAITSKAGQVRVLTS